MTDPTAITDTDLAVLTLEDLADLRQKIAVVFDRKLLLLTAEERADDLARDYQTATGVEDGDEWVQAQGILGMVPLGGVRTNRDKLWESLIPNNVTEPGNPDDPQNYRWWKNLTDEAGDPEPGETPEWDGNGHVYATGDPVTFGGAEYTAQQAHTSQPTWTPAAVPALWTIKE